MRGVSGNVNVAARLKYQLVDNEFIIFILYLNVKFILYT